MKKKLDSIVTILLTTLMMVLLLVSFANAYEVHSLSEGDTYYGTPEISLVNLGSSTAKYSVNGEFTPNIGFLAYTEINNGVLWSIKKENNKAYFSFWPNKQISSIYSLDIKVNGTKTFTLDGKPYEISLIYLNGDEARLSINGINTGIVMNDDYYEIDNGVFWFSIKNDSVRTTFFSYPVCSDDNCEPLSCDDMDEQYFDTCRNYDGVCFDKYTGKYNGCGHYADCEINNVHADRNIFCPKPTSDCVDSDGDDIYSYGQVSYNGNIYFDECSSSGLQIMEKRCVLNEQGVKKLSNTVYDCPNGCSNGACEVSNNHEKLSLEGTLVTDGNSYDLFFNNSDTNLFKITYDNKEQTFVLDDNLKGTWVTNGVSVPVIVKLNKYNNYVATFIFSNYAIDVALSPWKPKSCYDNDGNDIYTRGSVTYNGLSHTDFCSDDLSVKEYTCVNNKLQTQIIRCLNGCSDGACNSHQIIPIPIVNNMTLKINKQYTVSVGSTIFFTLHNDDFGIKIDSAHNEVCYMSIKFPGSTAFNKKVKLHEGQTRILGFFDSALIVNEVGEGTCGMIVVDKTAGIVDSDNSLFKQSADGLQGRFYPGKDVYTKGYLSLNNEPIAVDSCVKKVTYSDGVNNGLLRDEYVDKSDKLMEQIVVDGAPYNWVYKCPNGCEDGACVNSIPIPGPTPPNRNKSDSWINEGETQIYYLNGVRYEVTPMFISDQEGVRLMINGKMISTINKGSVYNGGDYFITILDVDGGNRVKLILSANGNPPSPKPINSCNGCLKSNSCLPVGTRVANGDAEYCDYDKSFKLQKVDGAFCQNNYECVSNQCLNANCVSLEKQVQKTQGIIQSFIDWIKNIFG